MTASSDYERVPGVTRHCSICGIVVGRFSKRPESVFSDFETTEAWGNTDLSEYRCKDHTRTERKI